MGGAVFDLTALAADAGLSLGDVHLGAIAPRFVTAVGVGVLISARPWRLVMGRKLPRPEMVQAQILLCAAAAIITMVIGDSLAKAFGLVGLGSFVRFRSGLKDPRDAAVLFLVIGLGMACGHGSLGVAIVGALLGSVLLAALDLFRVPDSPAQDVEVPAKNAANYSGSGPSDSGSGTVGPIAPAIAAGDVGKRL
jgi:hypothetical protein